MKAISEIYGKVSPDFKAGMKEAIERYSYSAWHNGVRTKVVGLGGITLDEALEYVDK